MRRRLVEATQDGNLTAVRMMLAAGWPTDGRGQDDGTALHWAVFLGISEIARELLRYGAAVEARESRYNGTPLGWAIYGSVIAGRARRGITLNRQGTTRRGAKVPEDVENASDAVREMLNRYQTSLTPYGSSPVRRSRLAKRDLRAASPTPGEP